MITPIIMESDIAEVEKRLEILQQESAKRVHIDIGDGLFCDLLTVAPADFQQFDLSKLEIDIHLLVDDPTEWIEECVALGPQRLIAQIERMGSQVAYLEAVHGYGATKAGLALEISTPVEEIEVEALKKCEVVLLLSVPSGTSGAPFNPAVLKKIKELRKIYQGSILIDGGINNETEKLVMDAGASEVGENSSYWNNKL